ncbi:MAG: hypothetical protein K0M69_05970, partial [Youngiibacter sp.]|nr:hypothetical protein [Youngiibacter sp.]
KKVNPVLCGGTFLTQILLSRKPTTSRRQRTQGISDTFGEPDVLFGLIRLVQPDYIRPAGDTFRTYTSKYKKCDGYTPDALKFDNEVVISAFLERLETDYATELNKAEELANQFIDIGSTAKNDVLLVKRLIELIREDEGISDSHQFTVGSDGTSASKSELDSVDEVCLPAFLLSIWKFVVTERKDNSIGAATIAAWFPNAKNCYEGISGSTIKQSIKVNCILAANDNKNDEKKDVESESESVVIAITEQNSTQEEGTKVPRKSLLELFEDAIDKCNVDLFVDTDFTAEPLMFTDVIVIDQFIEIMRDNLRNFRRNQDAIYRNVILFVNKLEEYQTFLSHRMICEDGVRVYWLPRINWMDVNEFTLSCRRELERLYGLITGGRSLSIFGNYNVEDDTMTIPKDIDIKSKHDDFMTVESQQISRDYYNLFVTSSEIMSGRFTMPKDRSLRGESETVKKFADLNAESIKMIKTFPSLFMNENIWYGGKTSSEQEAYYGFVTDLRIQENGVIKIRFRCYAKVNQQKINDIADLLDIHQGSGVMELNHTHWTIKHVDLIDELTVAGLLPDELTFISPCGGYRE